MSEESTTSALVRLVQRAIGAMNRRDLDGWVTLFDPEAVWDLSPLGLGRYEGGPAIRGFIEDWLATYSEFQLTLEDVLDLGGGVVFAVVLQHGRLIESSAEVRMRYASVNTETEGRFSRITNYPDIEQARVAAERLAEERE
jgi:ketosteroid isomerase-like protein